MQSKQRWHVGTGIKSIPVTAGVVCDLPFCHGRAGVGGSGQTRPGLKYARFGIDTKKTGQSSL